MLGEIMRKFHSGGKMSDTDMSYVAFQALNPQKTHESNYSRLFTILQLYSDVSKIKSMELCRKGIDSLSCFISIPVVASFALDIYDRMRSFSEVSLEEKLKLLRVLVLNDKQPLLGNVYLPFLCKTSQRLNENFHAHSISLGICSSFMKRHIVRIRDFLSTISLSEMDRTILAFLLRRATHNAEAVTEILIPAMEFIPPNLLTPRVMEVVLKQALLVIPPHSPHAEELSRLLVESEKSLRESSTILSKTVALQNLAQLQGNGKFRRIIELAGEYFHTWYGLALLGDYYPLYHQKRPAPHPLIPPNEQFCTKLIQFAINALLHVEDIKGAKMLLFELGGHLPSEAIVSAPIENLRSIAPVVRIGAMQIFCEFCDKFEVDPFGNPAIFDHFVRALALLENANFLRQKSTLQVQVDAPMQGMQTDHDLFLGGSKISLSLLLDDSRIFGLICDSLPHRQALIRALLYQAVPLSMAGIKHPFMKLLDHFRSVSPALRAQWSQARKNLYIPQFQNHLNHIGDHDAAELLAYYGDEEQRNDVVALDYNRDDNSTHGGYLFRSARHTREHTTQRDVLFALKLQRDEHTVNFPASRGMESLPSLLWDLLFSCFTKVFMLRSGLHGAVSRFYVDFKDFISIGTLHFHTMAVLVCSHLFLLKMDEAFDIGTKWLNSYNGLKRRDSKKERGKSNGEKGHNNDPSSYHKRFIMDLEIIEEMQSLMPIWSLFVRDFKKRSSGRSFPTNEENSLVILDLFSAMNVPVKKEVIHALTEDFLIKCPTIHDVRKATQELHVRLENKPQNTGVDAEVRRILCLVLAIPPEIAHFRHRFYHYLFERKKGIRSNKDIN